VAGLAAFDQYGSDSFLEKIEVIRRLSRQRREKQKPKGYCAGQIGEATGQFQ
jgi:hypothetical protein